MPFIHNEWRKFHMLDTPWPWTDWRPHVLTIDWNNSLTRDVFMEHTDTLTWHQIPMILAGWAVRPVCYHQIGTVNKVGKRQIRQLLAAEVEAYVLNEDNGSILSTACHSQQLTLHQHHVHVILVIHSPNWWQNGAAAEASRTQDNLWRHGKNIRLSRLVKASS